MKVASAQSLPKNPLRDLEFSQQDPGNQGEKKTTERSQLKAQTVADASGEADLCFNL